MDKPYIDIEIEKNAEIKSLIYNYSAWMDAYKSQGSVKFDVDLVNIFEWLQVVGLSRNTVEMYNNIGFFLVEEEKYLRATYLLQKVVEMFPDRVPAHLNLADALYGLGEKSQAINSYKIYYGAMKNRGQKEKIPSYVLDRIEQSD